jgi:hypothetical protein
VLDHGHKKVFGGHMEGTSMFLPILCVFSPGQYVHVACMDCYCRTMNHIRSICSQFSPSRDDIAVYMHLIQEVGFYDKEGL